MSRKHLARLAVIALVAAVALGLRARAVVLLPADFDEDNYLRAAQIYAGALRSGDWSRAMNPTELFEHPALGKLAFGAAIAPLPAAPELPPRSLGAPPDARLPQPHWTVARAESAAFGVIAVAALAALDPVAGLMLAVSSWQVKYTSEVMVESLAALSSLLAVLFYTRSRRRLDRWLVLSAIALGLTAATKYVYCLAGVAILLDWAASERSRAVQGVPVTARLAPLLAWGTLAALVFLAADPELWPDPAGRLRDSLLYHPGYATGGSVRDAALPPWQPLIHLSESVPWHPGVFLFTWDGVISLFALLGLPGAWRRHRVFAIWLVVGLAFLLVWPTKWPQYLLTVTAPLAVSAADGVRLWLWEPARRLSSAVRKRANTVSGRAAADDQVGP